MGIQINGQTDIISATDGSLTIQGGSLGNVTGGLNVTSGSVGIGTDNASAAKLDVRGSDNPLLKLTQTTSGIARLNIESETNDGYQYAGIGIGSATADTELMWTTLGFDVNVANSVRLRIPSSGDVQVLTGNLVIGTSGKGIDFSATGEGSGTTTSELLDDYEEGSWTPEYAPSSGSFTSITYATQSGTYIKIGRAVYCHLDLATSSLNVTGASGNVRITGLPFNPQANTRVYAAQNNNWASNNPNCAVTTTSGQLEVGYNNAVNNTFNAISDLTTVTATRNEFHADFVYYVS